MFEEWFNKYYNRYDNFVAGLKKELIDKFDFKILVPEHTVAAK